MERLNKEYKLDINDNFSIKYGSVNRLMPIVIYVSGKAWITPTTEFDYSSAMKNILTKFKNVLKKQLSVSPYFHDKMIAEFDVNTSAMEVGKKKYFSFEFYLKQKGNVLKLKDVQFPIKSSIKKAIDDMAQNMINNTFILSKEKND